MHAESSEKAYIGPQFPGAFAIASCKQVASLLTCQELKQTIHTTCSEVELRRCCKPKWDLRKMWLKVVKSGN